MSVKILHVIGELNRGGAETMIMNLYRSIDRSRFQFDFVIHTTEKCAYSDEIIRYGGRIHSVPRYNVINHRKYVKAWHSIFQDNPEYRIIHGHMRSTAAIYLPIAKKYGLVSIAHSHNTSSGDGLVAIVKNVMQYPIRYTADYLLACSKAAGIWLYGKGHCKRNNFYILNNAIQTDKFVYNKEIRQKRRHELRIEDSFVVGTVGRLTKQKNPIFILEVFKRLLELQSNVVLLWVGDGELFEQTIHKSIELGVSDKILFMGERSDVNELFQAMDVFLFPSLWEGLGMVVIEAQAAGLPCIIADTIPVEAYVTDLIKPIPLSTCVDEWAAVILNYYGGYERRNYLSSIINKGFDLSNTVEWISNFYQSLVLQDGAVEVS